jgi:hypothetical protein
MLDKNLIITNTPLLLVMSAENSFSGYDRRVDHNPVEVTCGEKLDGPELPKFRNYSERGNYIVVIIGDATYSGKENLKITSGQSIKAVAYLNLSITQGFRKYD